MRCFSRVPDMSNKSVLTRIVLVDDHPAFCIGLQVLLDREVDMSVVGEAQDGPHALRLCLMLARD